MQGLPAEHSVNPLRLRAIILALLGLSGECPDCSLLSGLLDASFGLQKLCGHQDKPSKPSLWVLRASTALGVDAMLSSGQVEETLFPQEGSNLPWVALSKGKVSKSVHSESGYFAFTAIGVGFFTFFLPEPAEKGHLHPHFPFRAEVRAHHPHLSTRR